MQNDVSYVTFFIPNGELHRELVIIDAYRLDYVAWITKEKLKINLNLLLFKM